MQDASINPYPDEEFNISGFSQDFTKKYLTNIDQKRYSICNVILSYTNVLSIREEYASFKKKHPNPKTFVNMIFNEGVSMDSFDALFDNELMFTDEIINFMNKLFNIRSHLRARQNKAKPDFFVSSLFATSLMGPDLDSFSHTDVNNFVKRSPFINFFKGYRKVFFPVNQNKKHWTLIVIDFEIKSLTYFDSCGRLYNPIFC